MVKFTMILLHWRSNKHITQRALRFNNLDGLICNSPLHQNIFNVLESFYNTIAKSIKQINLCFVDIHPKNTLQNFSRKNRLKYDRSSHEFVRLVIILRQKNNNKKKTRKQYFNIPCDIRDKDF